MSEEKRSTIENMISQLKQERDELRLKMHLGKEDLKDEWDKIDEKFAALNQSYEPLKGAIGETADEVWDALKLVGSEIRDGFHRIRKSL